MLQLMCPAVPRSPMPLDQQNSQLPPCPYPPIPPPSQVSRSQLCREKAKDIEIVSKECSWTEPGMGTEKVQRKDLKRAWEPGTDAWTGADKGVPGVSGQDPLRKRSSRLGLESDSHPAEEPGGERDLDLVDSRKEDLSLISESEGRRSGSEMLPQDNRGPA